MRVLLRDDQKAALDELSARTGLARSHLVRRGVDLLLASDGESWRAATRAVFGMWRDRTDIAPLSRRFRERS